MQEIFDAAAIRAHRDRAAGLILRVAPVLADLAAPLLDRLDDTSRRFANALDFGGRGAVAPALLARGMAVASADISPAMAAIAGGTPLILGPESDFGLPSQKFDLVVANLSLHGFNDLPGTLIQLRRSLVPEGMLLASMPVLGTLDGLRAALLDAEEDLTGGVSPRVAPFPTLADAAGLLSRAGFALPVADALNFDFLYADPLALLHELRAAGETNAVRERSRRTPPRTLFPKALSRLPVRDGRLLVQLRLAMLTGWAS
jgi:NADH dehydrogenase [ubiquinone] 1 alpha subcomplex assembly factor 5